MQRLRRVPSSDDVWHEEEKEEEAVRSEPLSTTQRVAACGWYAGLAAWVTIIVTVLGVSNKVSRQAGAGACVSLMVVWWVTSAVPLPVTGLLPVVLMPLTGAASAKTLAAVYLSDPVMLLFGSLLVAAAVERHGVHERLARSIVEGAASESRLVFGILTSTFVLSMWMSNTATASMMAPFAAVAARGRRAPVANACALSVAFGSSLGGLSTITGTGPNVVLQGITGIAFADWFFVAFPLGLCLVVALWLLLVFNFGLKSTKDTHAHFDAPKEFTHQRTVMAALAAMVVLWLARRSRFGVPGWTQALPDPAAVTDATVAMAAALCLFLAGALPWKAVNAISWDAIFLVAGGLAMSAGVREAHLDDLINSGLDHIPIHLRVPLGVLLALALSNAISNAAAANILLPLHACLHPNDPLHALVPITLACSLAFLFPVSTPPNAIVLAHAPRLTTVDMFRVGAQLTLVALVLLVPVAAFVVPAVFAHHHKRLDLCDDDDDDVR